jgi:CubicO group peptidase (beta-lactamase class C family)
MQRPLICAPKSTNHTLALKFSRSLIALILCLSGLGAANAAINGAPGRLDLLLPPQLEEGLHSLLVYKNGTLLFEDYYVGNDDHIDFEDGIKIVRSKSTKQWGRKDKHYVASVTKAVTALLTGIAMEELNLEPESLILDLASPELGSMLTGPSASLTLHHLLSMQTGYEWDEWHGDDLAKLWKSKDFAQHLLNKRNTGPSTFWRYNSAAPNLLLSLLEKQLQQPLGTWADKRFFKPLGIEDYDWTKQPTGTPEGSARLHLRPQDMLKIGILILNEGKQDGQQVVPKEWINLATKPQVALENGSYGYYFWLRDIAGIPYISAEGDGGQYINIFPKEKLVIVMTGGDYLDWATYYGRAQKVMRNHVLPSLGIDIKAN